MHINSGIGKACVLVAFELENGMIHKAGVENAERTQKVEILCIKTGHFFEKTGFKLGYNVLEAGFTVVGKVHKYGNS